MTHFSLVVFLVVSIKVVDSLLLPPLNELRPFGFGNIVVLIEDLLISEDVIVREFPLRAGGGGPIVQRIHDAAVVFTTLFLVTQYLRVNEKP